MQIAAVYNPQEMPEALFVERFVVRRDTLEELLKRIRQAAPGDAFKHTIIQGQRGQGKTTLLRKLSICVRDDAELAPWLLPILFREEEYSVTSLCRLWELAAEHLAERPEFAGLPEQFEEAYLSPHYETDCFSLLADALQKADKSLLLLIDNLGEMLAKFGLRDQQRLREILQTSRRIRIVGASAATLEQHYDQGKPFFQFFTMKSLEGLNAEEARELLLGLGDAQQTEKMREILRTRPGKVEALRRLTAGVPRTLILLFEIFLDDHGSALHDLDLLLDRVTPLYKHRLDDLPAQQQAIVHAIALGWDALSTKEIAQKTRLPSKQVSAQLSQLEKNRIVRRIPTSSKNHLYQLEERFFNIWCLMRLGRANDRRRATWLVRFLEAWCDDQELAERAERHLGAMRAGHLQAHHALLWSQALAQTIRDFDLQERVLDATRAALPQLAEDLPESDLRLFDKATEAYERGDWKSAEKLIQPLADKGYPAALNNIASFLQKNNPEQAERYYLMAIEQGDVEAMFNLGLTYDEQGNLEEAKRYYLMAVEQGSVDAMVDLGIMYKEQGKLEEAERYYLMAIEQSDVDAMFNLGLMYDEQGKLKEAEHYYLMAVEKGYASAMYNLALLRWTHIKQPHKALELSRKQVDISFSEPARALYSVIALWCNEFAEAFSAITALLNALSEKSEKAEFGDYLIANPYLMLAAKGQTAFALKLFEDERYQKLSLKERFKPLYYAILQEAGESRQDEALRMGPELQQTVAEIRARIAEWRERYRLPPNNDAELADLAG